MVVELGKSTNHYLVLVVNPVSAFLHCTEKTVLSRLLAGHFYIGTWWQERVEEWISRGGPPAKPYTRTPVVCLLRSYSVTRFHLASRKSDYWWYTADVVTCPPTSNTIPMNLFLVAAGLRVLPFTGPSKWMAKVGQLYSMDCDLIRQDM